MRSAAVARQSAPASQAKDALVIDHAMRNAASLPAARSWLARMDWTKFSLLLGLVLFGVAAYVLYRTLEQVTWGQVWAAWWRISLSSIVFAALATAGSYLA